MNLYQLFDYAENTWYVQATHHQQAIRWLEETYRVLIDNWCQLNFLPVNAVIHVAS